MIGESNEHEWYKAAYCDPTTSSYFQYPTSSNSPPIASSPTGLPNHANFSPDVPGGGLTDVGAYTGTTSPYGAFDMGGNVWQWNEVLTMGTSRGFRGGAFNRNAESMLSTFRVSDDATDGSSNVGFRVASIPEPSSFALAALSLLALAASRTRRFARPAARRIASATQGNF